MRAITRVTLLLALAGCSKPSSPPETTAVAPTAVVAEPAEPAAVEAPPVAPAPVPAAVAPVLLGGLGDDPARKAEAERFAEQARGALGPLKKNLLGALQAAMTQGAEHALTVCNTAAPGIASAASTAAGLEVGRVSDRARNPGNATQPWMAPAMARFEGSSGRAVAAPVVMPAPGGGLAYFEPIYTGGLCLTCHGAAITPEVQARIAALYPSDKATGFAMGDLRGAFRVVQRGE